MRIKRYFKQWIVKDYQIIRKHLSYKNGMRQLIILILGFIRSAFPIRNIFNCLIMTMTITDTMTENELLA